MTGALAARAALATAAAALVSGVVLVGASVVHFPAFGNSNVLQALTVVGQVAALALVAAGLLLRTRRGAALLAPTGAALLVSATLGLPLAATRLYLMGVSVDQEFRTQFLTRSATSTGLPDMAYADLPSFYPSGWFWLGGRLAQLTGRPGWEVYKPWAILSLSIAAALVTVLWTELLRPVPGTLAALASVAVVLAYASPEPYGAPVALFAPPALLLAWHAVAPTAPGLGRRAAVATTAYLGVSACFYTLYTALAAATVCLMALVAAAHRRSATPLVRLVAIGIGSGVIALLVWAPYLTELASGAPTDPGTAFHYLPESGASLPAPWSPGGLMGLLCTIGMFWLAVRCRDSRRAQALGLGVVTVYLWCLASMAATLLGSTLLGFRTGVVLTVLLAVAGTLCLTDLTEAVLARIRAGHPDWEGRVLARRTTAAAALAAALVAVVFCQSIPRVLHPEIRVAYTDTDGRGERADEYPPGAEAHYGELARVIDEATGRPEEDVVVASTADAFLAYHPYLAYQAITSHYANPLGRYAERNDAMTRWGEAETPEQLWQAVSDTPWRRPDAIVTRPSGSGYTLRLAADAYPNDPNVTRFAVTIPRSAVGGPHFTAHDVGPFTVLMVR